ncbi:MAG TPA: hypothetical protein VGX68_18220 [Thermoanaerobaculia bacterium]|jgi:hypothetical protein|nr:hypothetical protein [Thermoanaerobaculia bacterium]
MHTVKNVVGRLVEVRVASPLSLARAPEELKTFLGEILTPLERSRLAEFLDEPRGAP